MLRTARYVGMVTYGTNAFIGSDLFGLTKPPAGTTCPAASTFKFGEKFDLRDPNGGPAFTPVVVNQIDPSQPAY